MDRKQRSFKRDATKRQFDADLFLSRYFPRSELSRFFSKEEYRLHQTPANWHRHVGSKYLHPRSALTLAREVSVRDHISLLRRPMQVEDTGRYCGRCRDHKRTPSTIWS